MYDKMDQNNFYTNIILLALQFMQCFSIGIQNDGPTVLSYRNPTSSGHAMMSNDKPQSVST